MQGLRGARDNWRLILIDARKAPPPGEIVMFNDFAHLGPQLGQYGVHRAVSEFVVGRNWPVVMFAFEPNGLYDIAIQKPERPETPLNETP